MLKQKEQIGKYLLDEELGSNYSEVVFKAIDVETAKIWAIKRRNKKHLSNPHLMSLFVTEVAIMKEITHPNILKLEEILETDEHYYLVIQYCKQGNFEDFMGNNTLLNLEEDEAVGFLKQIMNGFQELRKHKIIHRDFKLSNLFLNDGILIIGNFGLAKKGFEMTSTRAGCPVTMAPEILFNHGGNNLYNSKVDLWSIGCVYYQMLFGNLPFFAFNVSDLQQNIKTTIAEGISFPGIISDESKDLITSLLRVDPNERIEWDGFFSHPLFNKFTTNKILDFSQNFTALTKVALNTKGIDDEFEKNENILAQQPKILMKDPDQYSFGVKNLNLPSEIPEPQVLQDAENVRQNYVHQKNKISYMDYTVQKIMTLLKRPMLKPYYNSLIDLGLLISKKAVVISGCVVNHLKTNSNFLSIEKESFDNFIKSKHVCDMVSNFQAVLATTQETFQDLQKIQQALNSDLAFADSPINLNNDLPVLDNNLFQICNSLLRRTLDLKDVFHNMLKQNLASILVLIKNVIDSEKKFPFIPNPAFSDFKFNWEEFYKRLSQMDYEEIMLAIKS